MYEVIVHGQLRDSNPALATPADEPRLDPLLVAGVVAVELDVSVVAAAGGGLEPTLLTLAVLQPGLLHVVHQLALFLAYFCILQQCWGFVTFWCGIRIPGSVRYLWLMDPDPTTFFIDF
jgi:hypothetical protein